MRISFRRTQSRGAGLRPASRLRSSTFYFLPRYSLLSALLLSISYIGHATLLIELGGLRLLTDPNFDAQLGRMLKRVAVPSPALDALPSLHAVLVTHMHADHLSFASLAALARKTDVAPPVYAPPAVARWIGKRGYPDVRPVLPGEVIRLEGGPPKSGESPSVTVYVGAAAHEGSRYGIDRWSGRGMANTYLMDSGSESVFFVGDTGLRPNSHLMVTEILGRANRRLDVALLPIGYSPWWRPGFRRHHLSPADALLFFDRLQARVLIPYHWGTFHHLTSGPFDAMRQLERLLPQYPQRAGVRMVAPGSNILVEASR
jgi:L-ascorbate metabolism protein UlaG (beta-lactamase superfamily)